MPKRWAKSNIEEKDIIDQSKHAQGGSLYELAIIGGGVAGIFSALMAAQNSVRTIIIDPNKLGGGATIRSAGVVTLQLDEEDDVKLVKRSIELIKQYSKSSWRVTGFLQLGRPNQLQDSIESMRRAGVEFKLLSSSEIESIWPEIISDERFIGVYTSEDLSLEPTIFIDECRQSLLDAGVELLEDEGVVSLDIRDGEVKGALLSNGKEVKAEQYILSAGAWTREILSKHGYELMTMIITCYAYRFDIGEELGLPSFSDEWLHSYWRPWNTELIGGGYDADFSEKPDISDAPPPQKYIQNSIRLMQRRVRLKSPPRLVATLRGPCSVTSDMEPIIGHIEGLRNLVLIDGLRGYGLMRGPAIGELAANLILNKPVWLNLKSYAPARAIIKKTQHTT
ncbi:MAG: FAD-binding oxidoreductase [Nitrososphaerota archaeon]